MLLTNDEVEDLLEDFDSGFVSLWNDVVTLADACVKAVVGGEDDAVLAWHHLLMCIGNFKRQTPIFQLMTSDTAPLLPKVPRPPTLRIRAGVELDMQKLETWKELEEDTRGIGVPTTSTILAALWPDHHAIFDRRTATSCTALMILAASEKDSPLNDFRRRPPSRKRKWKVEEALTWHYYRDWYLSECVVPIAEGCKSMQRAERALFVLPSKVEEPPCPGRSWEDYAKEVAKVLGR